MQNECVSSLTWQHVLGLSSEETQMKGKLQKLFLCSLIFDTERQSEILMSPNNKKWHRVGERGFILSTNNMTLGLLYHVDFHGDSQ